MKLASQLPQNKHKKDTAGKQVTDIDEALSKLQMDLGQEKETPEVPCVICVLGIGGGVGTGRDFDCCVLCVCAGRRSHSSTERPDQVLKVSRACLSVYSLCM